MVLKKVMRGLANGLTASYSAANCKVLYRRQQFVLNGEEQCVLLTCMSGGDGVSATFNKRGLSAHVTLQGMLHKSVILSVL